MSRMANDHRLAHKLINVEPKRNCPGTELCCAPLAGRGRPGHSVLTVDFTRADARSYTPSHAGLWVGQMCHHGVPRSGPVTSILVFHSIRFTG